MSPFSSGPPRIIDLPPVDWDRHPRLSRPEYEAIAAAARSARPRPSPPFASPDQWIAPLRDPSHAHGAAAGSTADRPWRGLPGAAPMARRITAAIPHLDTPDLLRLQVEALRLQTDPPAILILDGGSLSRHAEILDQLESESDDVEVIRFRFRGMPWCNWGVAAAMDTAFAACRTPYLLSIHTDAFLRRRDVLAELAGRCDARTPAVGYQMSERDSMAPWSAGLWRGMLGHSLSIYHMPTMKRIRATWDLARSYEVLGLDPDRYEFAWPDVETGIGLAFRESGIGFRTLADPPPGEADPPSALSLGDETNQSHGDHRYWHVRGTGGHRLYYPHAAAIRRGEIDGEAEALRERIEAWRAEVPRLAEVGDGVWVGNAAACRARSIEFERVIHLYSDGTPPAGLCHRITDGESTPGLAIRYSDGEALATASVPLDEIAAYAAGPGKLLVHCAAGQCRGPTFAALALVARGRGFAEARDLVARAVGTYGVIPSFWPAPMADLESWSAGRAPPHRQLSDAQTARVLRCPHRREESSGCCAGRALICRAPGHHLHGSKVSEPRECSAAMLSGLCSE